MKRWPRARIGVYVLVVLTVLYLVALSGIVWGLFTSGELIGVLMAAALLIFPILGVAFIWRDLQFAHQGDRLLAKLADAEELPEDDLPRQPSGRPDRATADSEFPRWKAEVEAAPEDYRAWARLALAYRASGDTPRARRAMRKAIELESKAG